MVHFNDTSVPTVLCCIGTVEWERKNNWLFRDTTCTKVLSVCIVENIEDHCYTVSLTITVLFFHRPTAEHVSSLQTHITSLEEQLKVTKVEKDNERLEMREKYQSALETSKRYGMFLFRWRTHECGVFSLQ